MNINELIGLCTNNKLASKIKGNEELPFDLEAEINAIEAVGKVIPAWKTKELAIWAAQRLDWLQGQGVEVDEGLITAFDAIAVRLKPAQVREALPIKEIPNSGGLLESASTHDLHGCLIKPNKTTIDIPELWVAEAVLVEITEIGSFLLDHWHTKSPQTALALIEALKRAERLAIWVFDFLKEVKSKDYRHEWTTIFYFPVSELIEEIQEAIIANQEQRPLPPASWLL